MVQAIKNGNFLIIEKDKFPDGATIIPVLWKMGHKKISKPDKSRNIRPE